MKKQPFNVNRGVTFIELMIVVSIAALFMVGVFNFFRNTYEAWTDTRDTAAASVDARTASNEMAKYIRQASTDTVVIGASNDSITFDISKSTTAWHQDLTIKYFKSGSELKRLMKGSTSTVISEGVELFYVWHDTGTASSYALVGTSVTVKQGDKTIDINKKIMLRVGK